MADYKPLSVRRGLRPALSGVEGIPPSLRYPLRHWLEGRFGYRDPIGMRDSYMMDVAVAACLSVSGTHEPGGIMNQIIGAAERDDDVFLDVLDATLQVASGTDSELLRRLLDNGGSAWTVSTDGKSIQRRVDETAAAAATAAMSPGDEASAELGEAWAKLYGLNPDPSDAWDHAIKAVEAVLIPIVVPAKAKATLGDVLGALKADPAGWTFVLATSSTALGNVETVEALLRLMWPNPDRHGGSAAARSPSLLEAQAVVQIAVAVVQWGRAGALARLTSC